MQGSTISCSVFCRSQTFPELTRRLHHHVAVLGNCSMTFEPFVEDDTVGTSIAEIGIAHIAEPPVPDQPLAVAVRTDPPFCVCGQCDERV